MAAIVAGKRNHAKKQAKRGPLISSHREQSMRNTWSSPNFKAAMEKSFKAAGKGVSGPEQANMRVAKCVKAAAAGDRDASSALNLQIGRASCRERVS